MYKIENQYKCIKLVDGGSVPASEAKKQCKSEMAQVPAPMTQQQFEDYASVFKPMNTDHARMWIGINDLENEGTFININTGQTWTKPASVRSSIDGNDNNNYLFMGVDQTTGEPGLEDVDSDFSSTSLLCERDLGNRYV